MSGPTNDGMVADGVHQTSLMHPEAEQRTDLGADCEMPPVRRKNRSLHPAPTSSERRCNLGRHGVPQLGLVRGSLDAVEQVDERLEAGVAVRGGKFEVDGQAGQLTDAKIVRMAFPAAPKTWLGFDRGTDIFRSPTERQLLRESALPTNCSSPTASLAPAYRSRRIAKVPTAAPASA